MKAARLKRGDIDRRRRRYLFRLVCAVCAASATLLLAGPLHAEGLAGRFEVRSADLELKGGVYHLNARIDLPISGGVRRGLVEGGPLSLEVDLGIERGRPLLPNSSVAGLTQRYRLE